ncbi:MAG: helix-turn-helix transcriptional regulator [Lachnospiraceae bacterium]|nr:helix-turn-helix transcriptional regulator [Lachnospiraceae bacterium]
MQRNIDVMRTGIQLKRLISGAGYTVAEVRDYLGLMYPQVIYRWYKGKTLPDIEHFLGLGKLLNRHIDELIVLKEVSKEA